MDTAPKPTGPPGRPDATRWYTKAEAAEALRVSVREIDRLIERGALMRYRLADSRRGVRLDADAVDRLVVPDGAPVPAGPVPVERTPG